MAAAQEVDAFAFALDALRFYCDYFAPAFVDRITRTAESAIADVGGDPSDARWAPLVDAVAQRASAVREATGANAVLFRAIVGASKAPSLLEAGPGAGGRPRRVPWNLPVRVSGRPQSAAPGGEAPRTLWRTLLEAQPFVLQVLAQLKREWTAAGAEERAEGYGPILEALERWHATQAAPREATRVLVPGAALGRLAWEAAARGFRAQANEDNAYMLVASFALMNALAGSGPGAQTICPDAHAALNCRSFAGPCQRLALPDVDVASVFASRAEGGEPRLTFAAGDFVQVYGPPAPAGQWDAVLTAFFIDTGTNLLRYLAAIAHALRPGGLWVNLGALLYNHFSESNPVPEADLMARIVQAAAASSPAAEAKGAGQGGTAAAASPPAAEAKAAPRAGRPFTLELTAAEVAAAAACFGLQARYAPLFPTPAPPTPPRVREAGERRVRYCAAGGSMLAFAYDGLFLVAVRQ